jgi:hypothetical protein
MMLYMLDGLLTWTAHSERQEVWAGPSWSSFAFKVRSLLLPGFQNPFKTRSIKVCCMTPYCRQLRATLPSCVFC